MHIEFLVEEPSMETALLSLLPRILSSETTNRIIQFQGKQNLLRQLPARLRGYAAWITDEYKIVVLVDEDREDCHALKSQLENAALEAGLTTKTGAGQQRFQVLNRIVIEELEAWFIGDVNALCQAYPKLPRSFGQGAKFRNPDAVPGGTWEALEAALQRHGYFPGGYLKVQAAREISPYMDPQQNQSSSFRVFRDGLLLLA